MTASPQPVRNSHEADGMTWYSLAGLGFICLHLTCLLLLWLPGSGVAQRGPLWWVARHRQHHRYADTAFDLHSPVVHSVWWAHMGWLLCRQYKATDRRWVQDWCRYPELCWLDRYFLVPPAVLAVGVGLVGLLLERSAPGLRTSGLQMLVYG